MGLDVTADGGALIVHPLFAPEALAYFRATRVLIRCREVEVVWDVHGRRYGGARGLSVLPLTLILSLALITLTLITLSRSLARCAWPHRVG